MFFFNSLNTTCVFVYEAVKFEFVINIVIYILNVLFIPRDYSQHPNEINAWSSSFADHRRVAAYKAFLAKFIIYA